MARRGRLVPDLGISAPVGRCTHIGAGTRRDRFSTIDKRGRRCLREPAHGLREWPRAMARRGRRFADLAIPLTPMLHPHSRGVTDATDSEPSINGGATEPVAAHRRRACRRAIAHRRRRIADLRDSVLELQLAPVGCTHECNSYLCTLMTPQTVRDSSKDCFHGQFRRLTRECRARATCRAYKHPIGHVHLVQRISTLDNIEGQGDRWSGDLGHGTTNERRRHLTAIRELAR